MRTFFWVHFTLKIQLGNTVGHIFLRLKILVSIETSSVKCGGTPFATKVHKLPNKKNRLKHANHATPESSVSISKQTQTRNFYDVGKSYTIDRPDIDGKRIVVPVKAQL